MTTTTRTFTAKTHQTRLAFLSPEQARTAERGLAQGLTALAALDIAELPTKPNAFLSEWTVNVQTSECGRCGGSGHYSYNQMDGSRCYGCAGSGQAHTKLGKRAKADLDAWKMECASTTAAQLLPGDGFIDNRRRYTVVSVAHDLAPTSWTVRDGVRIPNALSVRIGTASGTHFTIPATSVVQVPLRGGLWTAFCNYASGVRGVVLGVRVVTPA